MLTTSNINSFSFNLWQEGQQELINSLTLQPLVVVLRISQEDLDKLSIDPLISLVNKLNLLGIKHIEIAWSSHKNWIIFIKELKSQIKISHLGAASITNLEALEIITNLDFKYAMTPYWDKELQQKAQVLGKVLIPGVFSPSEIQQAFNFGYRIIKLFPASTLGLNYVKQVKASLNPFPFIIAAGGIKVVDIDIWLNKDFSAVALGRELIKNNKIDPLLEQWLKVKTRKEIFKSP